jgi:chromate reductase
MASTPLKILGLSGSLRRSSYNTAALRAAQELAGELADIEIASIADIPHYDADVQAHGFPRPVQELADRIRAADAVLFASPEYNYSMPGVLKNAIDWVSRTPAQPFAGKPVAMMGASTSLLGAARAQYHLRQTLVFLDASPINKPEVFIAQAQTRFDEGGRLVDEATRGFVRSLIEALVAWTRRLQAGEQARRA